MAASKAINVREARALALRTEGPRRAGKVTYSDGSHGSITHRWNHRRLNEYGKSLLLR